MVVSKGESNSTHLWRQCFGHMREKGIKVLVDHKLLPTLKSLNLNFCKHCIYGKQCRQNFKR